MYLLGQEDLEQRDHQDCTPALGGFFFVCLFFTSSLCYSPGRLEGGSGVLCSAPHE